MQIFLSIIIQFLTRGFFSIIHVCSPSKNIFHNVSVSNNVSFFVFSYFCISSLVICIIISEKEILTGIILWKLKANVFVKSINLSQSNFSCLAILISKLKTEIAVHSISSLSSRTSSNIFPYPSPHSSVSSKVSTINSIHSHARILTSSSDLSHFHTLSSTL